MKRAVLLTIALILLLPLTATGATGADKACLSFALVEIDTGASGSSVNYFVLRPLMEYDDEGGIAKDAMFDSLIFSLSNPPQNAEGMEAFISDLFKEGTCITAAETVAGEMKEDGFLKADAIYPIYVSVPYISAEADNSELYRYFVDTLTMVFADKKYKNIALTGLYFSAAYDADPILRSFCTALAKDKGLDCVASTAIGGNGEARFIASSASIKNQLDMDTEGKGYSLKLNGVPDDNDNTPYTKLVSDYNALRSAKIGNTDILISFRAYNDAYDCASSIENAVPNTKGRKAYELLKEIINCPFDESSVPTEGENKLPWHYFAFASFAVVGTAGIIHLTVSLYKKGKNNG